MPSTGREPEWDLFLDWCAATDRAVATEADRQRLSTLDLLDYARQVRCSPATLQRRLRVVSVRLGWVPARAAARRERGAAPAWRTGPGWLDLPEALLRCETAGWPGGFRGRRDAWLLVLLAPPDQGGAGLSRDSARVMPARRVTAETGQVAVNGHVLGTHREPASCPACAAVRWLHVAALAHRWGRSGAREHLTAAHGPQSHVCGAEGVLGDPGATGGLDGSWRAAWHLAPAIDQHGWPTDWRPMSARAVTAVTNSRCDRLVPVAEQPERDERDLRPRRHADLALEDLFAALDEAAESADDVNARVNALLDDTAGMLGTLTGTRRGSQQR